jgi:anthranilate synthase component 1
LFSNTLRPSLDEVLAGPTDASIPVWRALPSDTETPISAFLKLRRRGTGFLLESAEQDGSLGRYSFIGVGPDAVLRADLDRGTVETQSEITSYEASPIDALRQLVGDAPVHHIGDELPGFVGGAVGALGFDLVRSIEKLPSALPDPNPFPAAIFARYATTLVFDHLKQRLLVVSVIPPNAPREEGYRRASAHVEEVVGALRQAAPAPPFEATGSVENADRLLQDAERAPDDDTFLEAVARAREYIWAGDAIQVVLSRRLKVPVAGDPFRLYRALRVLNPSPYMFFLEFPDVTLVGASPEMLLRVADGVAQVCPIAGTRPRGKDPDEDAALEEDLRNDPKERAEHVMLVDLGRNDLGRVCRVGSVHVPSLMTVERYSNVMHLVSSVTGRLRDEVDTLEALKACFPAGTVSGAPKIRAMEIIEELEAVRRGAYAGAIGYIGFGASSLDTCISIRTIAVEGGHAHVQAGAGIVADSVPEKELAETNAKAKALFAALALGGVDDRPGNGGHVAAAAANREMQP